MVARAATTAAGWARAAVGWARAAAGWARAAAGWARAAAVARPAVNLVPVSRRAESGTRPEFKRVQAGRLKRARLDLRVVGRAQV